MAILEYMQLCAYSFLTEMCWLETQNYVSDAIDDELLYTYTIFYIRKPFVQDVGRE